MSQTFPAPVTLLADTVHFKEFYGGYTGTCGETALTAALICAERLGQGAETHDAAVALMLSVTSEMRAAGWADANGASTLWSLAQEAAKKRGAQIALEWDYAEPFPHDWHSVLLANAGIKPIVLQVGMAMNLVGQDGTGHAEAGVHYHFICVVGKCADGYIVMDGDNYLIEQELAIYSYATLQAADICGLLMLDVVPAPAPKPAPAPTPAPTPAPAPAPSPVAADAAKMNALFGKTVAWVGNEALKWAVSDFTNAAKTLKSLGFEGMCVKRADGTNKWFSSTAQIAAEKAAVEAEGLKYVPFTYCYGPKFGDANLDGECAILKELASVAGVVQADMETEWNGNVTAAERFASNMKSMPEPLSITIVADPAQQNWNGVMAALAPVCNAWVPQYYDTYLSQQPLPSVATVVQPGVDITNEYGANDPVAIAAKSANSVFVWEYETVLQNPALATQIVARSSKGLPMNPTFFTANSDGIFHGHSDRQEDREGFPDLVSGQCWTVPVWDFRSTTSM